MVTKEKIEVRCSNCGALLEPDKDTVIQLEEGHVNKEGVFYSNSPKDINLYCSECV